MGELLFQSLLGLLIDCNCVGMSRASGCCSVSIPFGSSNRLQRENGALNTVNLYVSIPFGSSNRLQLNIEKKEDLENRIVSIPFGSSNRLQLFQYLSVSAEVISVSIPFGSSNRLQPAHHRRRDGRALVSIPFGSSNRLQRHSINAHFSI